MNWLKLYDIDSTDNRNQELIDHVVRRYKKLFWWVYRPTIEGIERIPDGKALYVANHNSGLIMPEAFLFCCAAYEWHGLGALPYGLAHEIFLRLPVLHQIFVQLGAIRASHENARKLFAEGHKVLVFPGGDKDAMRSYRDRHKVVFAKRRGYIRLALREEVPIVPVVSAGAHQTLMIFDDGQWLAENLKLHRLLRTDVWPISFSIPWGLWIGVPPPHIPLRTRVYIEALEPIEFERYGDEAAGDAEYVEQCHRRVHSKMQKTLKRLAKERAIKNWGVESHTGGPI